MKTTINIIIASTLLAVATSATAKSWRINNNAATASNFNSINAAMSSNEVTAGDTLYLDPGTTLSDQQTVTKQVTIVGPGYFRGNAPHRHAYFHNPVVINAANVKLEGLVFDNNLNICAQQVTVERCIFKVIKISNGNYANAKYATIRQCYGQRVYGNGETSIESAFCKIENCILINSYDPINGLYLPVIQHNYLKCTSSGSGERVLSRLNGAKITDNIIINSSSSSLIYNNVNSSEDISHNIFSGDTNASFPDNKYGYTEADIFTLTGMNDQLYQLKEDSPAKGYATDGGDCGPYGGLTPYVPGGLPNGYPYYTKAIIPAKSKNGKVNVSLKIKMQNE